MECAEVRAALSARLDGEDAAVPGEIVDAHVAQCEECQAWYAQATAIGRDLRLRANPPAPTQGAGADLAAKVLQVAAELPEVGGDIRRRQLPLLGARIALAVLAVVYFLWAILLFAGSTAGTADPAQLYEAIRPGEGPQAGAADPELAKYMIDAAISRFALGAGLAWASWAPRAAGGLLPIYLGMWAFGGGFATRDIVMGLTGGTGVDPELLGSLAIHLAAVIALGTCWLSRHHTIRPLRDSWHVLSAKPMNFSAVDAEAHSRYYPGDHRRS